MKQLAPGVTMDWQIMSGTPCLAGTRIPTWTLAGMFMGGKSAWVVANEFNSITAEDVENAVRYEFKLKTSGKRRPRARREAHA